MPPMTTPSVESPAERPSFGVIERADTTDRTAGDQTQPRRHVCHLSMTLSTGGLERLLVEFGRLHDRTRYDLSFIALEGIGAPGEELRAAGFPVEQIKLTARGKWQGVRRLMHLLKERQVDILHTHNTYPQFYGALAARRARVPVVLNSQHGRGCGPGTKTLWQFRLANELTNRIVGVSEDATRLCQHQSRRHAGKMGCIHNGIDLDRFRFTGPAEQPVAISVGRLSPEKDYATLLRAVKIVVAQVSNFRLLLVGDGRERGPLEQFAEALGITGNVEFLGERSDVHALLPSAGFFVSSSTTEGISLTLLEAMAVGLPIVTTAVGGSPEIVVPDVTGKLLPPQAPEQLAQGMLEMLELQPIWPEMGRAARERVAEKFNIRTMIHQYEALYAELLTEVGR